MTAGTYDFVASALDNSNNYNATLKRTIITNGNICGCNNGTYNYACGNTITESCTMNCNLDISGATCLTVATNDLVINGNSYQIFDASRSQSAIVVSSANVTIKNFVINNASKGIYFTGNNNTALNNTFYNNTYGIYSTGETSNITGNLFMGGDGSGTNSAIDIGGPNNTIIGNNISGYGITSYGIDLGFNNVGSTYNNTIFNNTITNCSYGVALYDSVNNLISSNIIKYCSQAGYTSWSGGDETGVVNNTIINCTITNNSISVYIWGPAVAKAPYPFAKDNIFINSILNSNEGGIDIKSSAIVAGYDLNNTFLNCTFNKSNIVMAGGGSPNIVYVQWWVDVATNYTNESAGNYATVKAYDKNNVQAFSDTVDATTGLISRQNVTEFYKDSTGATYLTNYSFNASKDSYESQIEVVNITGNNISADKIQLTLTESNTAPEIEYVSAIPATDPLESNAKAITFSFTAYDAQHVADLDAATIKVNLSVSGVDNNVSHYNTTCVDSGNIDADRENFTCAVDLWYWEPDTKWNVTINISDDSALESTNSSTWFSYNTLTAIKIGPSSISFTGASAGSKNITGSAVIVINNTGNDAHKNISVNASNLFNSTALTTANRAFLAAENFTVDIETGASKPECDIGGGATSLINATYVNITGALLLRGNNTINEGQKLLYYCLTNVSSSLPTGTYDSTLTGPWFVKILLAAVIPAESLRRLKKKRKKVKELSEQTLLEVFDEKLKEKYGLGIEQIVDSVKKERQVKEMKEVEIPITVLEKDRKSKLGPSEKLVKYLKENLGLKLSEIARLLNRDQRTIWLTYNNAANKMKAKIVETKAGMTIPASILRNRKLSILESIVMHLIEKGMKQSEIAELLGRDIRIIYTIYSRAKNKLKK